ncbi:type VI secretion system baseplate subunit TssF [Agrobacterium rubi]|uniref:Putative type VI secretion protein n=1 Tax=Agrobacterium rubi TR3 = NBRC 13261 TaxID=1368415 RepID=A0A081CT41_9HYPH|nr:type VI secretion system baseplate subunit TssF [Agrobacterium rubi]MBP1878647.1 type VI secretion system protein ImpG [Agrobacterium rubi]MCL6652992.1 type VI secretion system protein ImpG [Agrobacterium rubi]NTF10090.1 type VI secretion system baseplate subunit TssF [Agrobacterium rubi]NTF21732.1 type VI secretion system baseplate subunit TssF [Agrobacterium rubi]NTF28589.1 type VI secretion system baseplate subunit TssF [Agrobacterium rubi]
MADGFLEKYNDELFSLRKRASRFAKAFPKIAGRLRMTGEVADDPHVERLIQSFAYSAARVRQKLDDEFPELTDSLLETLYPHYLAPLPSMSVVHFTPSPALTTVQRLDRHSEVLAEPIGGESCRFRTAQDTDIIPLEISGATLVSQPIDAPFSATSAGAASCLKLSLRTTSPRPTTFREMGLSSLQIFISTAWQQATALYELLANHCVGLALAQHSEDKNAVFLPARNLKPSGFSRDQAMLPYPANSFDGYRLLTEFFALPQKFLFLDIESMNQWTGGDCELYIYLDAADARLERMVSAKDFVLNASPVINLFKQACEPINLDGTRTEYRLLPDARRQRTREIYGVESVQLTNRSGHIETTSPFFGRTQRSNGSNVFWQSYRRFDDDDGSSDTDIAFVDQQRGPLGPIDVVASVETLCINRELPSQLPFGGGHPFLQLSAGNEAIESIHALMPPTPAVRMTERSAREWRLVSHLLLNHLSLFDNGGAPLKDILSLYAFRDTPETRQLVEAITSVEASNSHARIGSAMVPGTDITLEFDPAMIDRSAAFVFASVLNHFFGLYTSINSFTRLTVTMRGQSEPLAKWPARAADRPLL